MNITALILEFMSYPAIIVACYLFAEGYKAVTDGKRNKWILAICPVLGATIAMAGFFTIPDFIIGANWLEVLTVGLSCGFAATWANQIVKNK